MYILNPRLDITTQRWFYSTLIVDSKSLLYWNYPSGQPLPWITAPGSACNIAKWSLYGKETNQLLKYYPRGSRRMLWTGDDEMKVAEYGSVTLTHMAVDHTAWNIGQFKILTIESHPISSKLKFKCHIFRIWYWQRTALARSLCSLVSKNVNIHK